MEAEMENDTKRNPPSAGSFAALQKAVRQAHDLLSAGLATFTEAGDDAARARGNVSLALANLSPIVGEEA